MDSALHGADQAVSGAQYWLAVGIFVTCFILIVSEKVHKTKVALFGAALTIALPILTQMEAFHSPHLGIDYNVIFLLISMMIIVNILGRSGVFEWSAVKLAKLARGRPFPILAIFLVFTAVFSALLDNVTTVLLFAPVTLLIADELELDPIPFLIGEALASNIGGAATLIGDPPNLMIASRSGLGFMDFVVNMGPAVVVMMGALLVVVWAFFGRRLTVDEERRMHILSMDEKRLIKDPVLVRKSLIVMALVAVGFTLHSVTHTEPATVALLGAAFLLLISRLDTHEILSEVEWPTIFFFIGLYIIIGGVVKVGLISDLSEVVIQATQPTEESMFTTSIVLLWFSGIASAFLDNIPYVATMSPLVVDMATTVFHGAEHAAPLTQETLHHPVLLPVWWALALGSCLGGNGTPIGASANVVVLGISEKSGRPISFLRFMAYGMPIMLLTLLISHVYLYLRYF
ncbi:MAG: ArsB/NhaD family transporter [Acidobacteriota bacterium]|nr:ArsB/NhaD family transporter [Acidobacteriota bacterium]